jgi:hypothetical protein
MVPDVEAIDRPVMLATGRDPSVEAAVSLLMDSLDQSEGAKASTNEYSCDLAFPGVASSRNDRFWPIAVTGAARVL